MTKHQRERVQKFVKLLFRLLDTEPSKRTTLAVSGLIVVSFGLGATYGQDVLGDNPVQPVSMDPDSEPAPVPEPEPEPEPENDTGNTTAAPNTSANYSSVNATG